MLTPTAMQSSQPKNNMTSKLIGIYKLELWNLLEPLEPLRGTLSRNFGITLLGTPFWNLHLELLLGTSEPLGTYNWNFGTSWILFLEPFAWNPYLEPRNLAGWLPQSAPGPSLAETPKLSAVGEKCKKKHGKGKPIRPSLPTESHVLSEQIYSSLLKPSLRRLTTSWRVRR